jgi:hypothetical protein
VVFLLYGGGFSQDYGELSLAGLGRIIERGARTIAFRGVKEKPLFSSFRQADEAGFTLGVGSDVEIEFV